MTKTSKALPTLQFDEVQFHAIHRKGKTYLTGPDLARGLGYSRADKVSQIYDRNKSEFKPGMTALVKLPTREPQIEALGNAAFETLNLRVSKNLTTTVRIFSLRGAHLIAMFARTVRAEAFRRWVLDVLEREIERLTQTATAKPAAALGRSRVAQAAYMLQAWFAVLDQMARLMSHRALARTIDVHESTLSQILNGSGKYGTGDASTDRIARRVAAVFKLPLPQPSLTPLPTSQSTRAARRPERRRLGRGTPISAAAI